MSLRAGGWFILSLLCWWIGFASPAHAFGIFSAIGLARGARWDAAPRMFVGVERSLDGGLRYSLQGGSYEAFRDLIRWSGSVPSVASFQQAVDDAFAAWTATDPATGIGTNLTFVADLATAAADGATLGAEIDVLAFDLGHDSFTAVVRNYSFAPLQEMQLTSGVSYFARPIRGMDIIVNTNPGINFTLPRFQLALTHEIGHTLGFQDVDVTAGPLGNFIDDNYDDTSNATALATLTNSFAHLIDPFNPAASPLSLFHVANGQPGFDSPGVDILMESNPKPSLVGDPIPLRNDDYAGRQFLYPFAASPLPGDYNNDGTVDAADYTVWRDTLGSMIDLRADGDDSGTVDQGDYSFWKTRFGNTLPTASTSSIPEPSSWLSLVLGLCIGGVLPWRERDVGRERPPHRQRTICRRKNTDFTDC